MQPKRTIPRVCRQCGGDFLASASAVNSGKGLLCSNACRYVGQTGRQITRPKSLTLPCDTCGKPVRRMPSNLRKHTYCSPLCREYVKAPPAAVFSDDGLTAFIPLGVRKGVANVYATIDASDAAWAQQWRWHPDKDGYAVREPIESGKRVRRLLHRELLGLSPGDPLEGDHIDRDRLNCRRSNLRSIPGAGNRQNVPGLRDGSSIYRGVTRNKQAGLWHAQVSAHGRNHNLGLFASEADAAEAARAGRQRLLPYAVD